MKMKMKMMSLWLMKTPKLKKSFRIYKMEYKEPKKRVTKNDKKQKGQIYSQKHVRNILKQKEATMSKKNDGAVHTPEHSLLTNGRVSV